jgi:hypothetical protein
MCAPLGVDPLASTKSFWGQLLGMGDFYHEVRPIGYFYDELQSSSEKDCCSSLRECLWLIHTVSMFVFASPLTHTRFFHFTYALIVTHPHTTILRLHSTYSSPSKLLKSAWPIGPATVVS